MVKIGDKAIDFELPDESGKIIRLSDFKGYNVILYFYPKDMSPGCTREACGFRDYYEEFLKHDAVVIGVSSDPPEKHRRFKEKYSLPFILLSDQNGEVMRKYGVHKRLGILTDRVTFVIDKQGIIRYIFKSQFRPKTHVKKALEILKKFGEQQ